METSSTTSRDGRRREALGGGRLSSISVCAEGTGVGGVEGRGAEVDGEEGCGECVEEDGEGERDGEVDERRWCEEVGAAEKSRIHWG